MWIDLCKNKYLTYLQKNVVQKKYKICANHFASNLVGGRKRKTLDPTATPTLYLPADEDQPKIIGPTLFSIQKLQLPTTLQAYQYSEQRQSSSSFATCVDKSQQTDELNGSNVLCKTLLQKEIEYLRKENITLKQKIKKLTTERLNLSEDELLDALKEILPPEVIYFFKKQINFWKQYRL